MLLSQLLRAPIGSRPTVRTDFDDDTLTLRIATTNPNASYPLCGRETWQVHSRYDRHLAGEPIFGHRVCLLMTVRRFFCSGSGCPRRVFTEPLDGFATKHARTTRRLALTHLASGSALGGEAGRDWRARPPCRPAPIRCCVVSSRPAAILEVPRDSAASTTGPGARHRYGTIVVDIETNDVIDLLPDRDAATIRTWLEAHPHRLVSRDRSSTTADGLEAASRSPAGRRSMAPVEEHARPSSVRLTPSTVMQSTETGRSRSHNDGGRIVPRRARAARSTEPVRRESLPAPTPASPRQEAA